MTPGQVRKMDKKVKLVCPIYPTKKSFRSKNTAIHAALKNSGKFGVPFRPYLCKCGKWHLSTQRQLTSV